jgi:hypothetical protein
VSKVRNNNENVEKRVIEELLVILWNSVADGA